MRDVALAAGAEVRVLKPGRLLHVRHDQLRSVVLELDAALTVAERDEAVAMLLPGDLADADEVLDRALGSVTLGELAARVRYGHLAELVDQPEAFRARFQPIVDLRVHEVYGHEALLRAFEGEKEIPAFQLFEAAASGGWTNVLDRIGRETAIRDAAPWLGDSRLFINFVPTSVYRPEVCLTTTTAAADRHGIDLRQVVFEVVETHRTTDVGHLLTVVSHYRQRGARIALDDVGSGYSSLNLVAQLRPDIVKIDMALIQALPDPSATAIVRAVTELSHGIGATVIAEGIETEAQADAAAEIGADLGQGWLFGRPEFADEGERGAGAAPTAPAVEPTALPSNA